MDFAFALVAFLFSLVFYLAGLDSRCWYRRLLLPGLLTAFGVLVLLEDDFFSGFLFAASALLVYFGFKGYGVALKKKQ